MNKIALILLSSLTLASCEKLQEGVVHTVEFPDRDPVISATLIASNADSLLHAYVTSTASVLDSAGPQVIQDAVITLEDSDGNVLYSFTSEDEIDTVYKLDLGGQLGQLEGDITLKVSAPEFDDVESTSSMPSTFTASIEYTPNADTVMMWGMQMIQDQYIVHLENNPNIHEAYILEFEGRYFDEFSEEETEWISIYAQSKPDPRVEEVGFFSDNFWVNSMLVSDETVPNSSTGLHDLYFLTENFDGIEGGMQLIEARVRIYSISDELERYYRNVNQFMENEFSFFAEPMLMYSNVSSGFGCFGLASEQVFDVDLD